MNKPPKLAKFLLRILSSREIDNTFIGDIEELFYERTEHQGLGRSKSWYWWEVVKSIPGFIKESIRWRMIMFKNYFKIVLRNMKRHKGYSFINIAGLAVGIACTILILLWVKDELSFDRFHKNANRICRIVFSTSDDGSPTNANGAFGVAPALKSDFPEVIETVRIRKMGQGVKRYVGYEEKKYYESRFFFAEPTVFALFDFPLVKGDPFSALDEPNSIVLTEETAKKYFGNRDPIGKTLEADPYNDGELMLFQVTGIAKNVPRQSHIHFDFLASYSSLKENTEEFSGFYQNFTYVLLRDKSLAGSLDQKLLDFLHRNWRKDPWYTISLQPLLDIRLHSRLKSEVEPTGNILYIYIFTAIAVLVLIIACINFMNLTTARAVKRAKEVGIRKVVGAQKNQLVHQFLGESLLLSIFSALAAILLVIMVLPQFNRLTAKGIPLSFLTDPSFILGVTVIALAVGLVSGIYPAFFLSAFQPVNSIKSGTAQTPSGTLLRKGLVIFQFALSIGIVFSTLTVSKQMNYIQSQNLGYDREQIVVIPLNKDLRQNHEGFRNELLKYPGIENTTTSSWVPTRGSGHLSFRFEGFEENLSQVIYGIDKEFIRTYGLKILAGKNIQHLSSYGLKFLAGKDILHVSSANTTSEFLVSELTTHEAGYFSPQEAVGKSVAEYSGQFRGHIVGVVNDIKIYSLHREPYSIIYAVTPIENHNYLSIRIVPQNISETIAYIQETWQRMIPSYPLDYFFLDASFEQMHLSDKKMGEIFSVFSILAIFVACLGLFGLAAFTADQKTKEIAVRKVLGASVTGIYLLLSREFIKLVVLANILAWPVAYFAMHKWLQSFAFRTMIGWEIFLISAGVALAIAVMTVSYQSIKAALANPVDSLRYE
jgi:putative ABC transport system permease protein